MIRINSSPYRNSHGRAPAGGGHWMFGIDTADPDLHPDSPALVAVTAATFTEARQEAIRIARARKPDVRELWVLP